MVENCSGRVRGFFTVDLEDGGPQKKWEKGKERETRVIVPVVS